MREFGRRQRGGPGGEGILGRVEGELPPFCDRAEADTPRRLGT